MRGYYKRPDRLAIRVIGPSIAYLELTQGRHTLIDSADASFLEQQKWQASWRKTSAAYYAYGAINRNGEWKLQSLHSYILGISGRSMVGDHINGNPLDNRRCNLRLATPVQNQHNARTQQNNKSGCRGVNWSQQTKRWVSRISINGKRKLIGNFHDKEAAIEARLAAEQQIHGEFIRS